MPRLTNSQFLANRRWLVQLWQDSIGTYANLTATDQWHLHAYYRPVEQLTDTEVIWHRIAITRTRPALPQQAGRALRKLQHGIAAPGAVTHIATQRRGKRVTQLSVRAVVKPEPDLQRLVKALLQMTRHPPKDPAEPD